MIRLARLEADRDALPAGLGELAAGGELDWLQLDYARPRLAAVEGRAPAELPTYAASFTEALRAAGKSLFLEPRLRVVASAGWSDAFACVEQAAAALVEAGCGDLAVSAVRGSNLLPILEMLVAGGVDLRHAETDVPWRELRDPILAADLQFGAGPFVTAMAEGARVIVAGCFDGATPLTAAAVHEFGWSWHDYDRLAAAAAAARCAGWSCWVEGDQTATLAVDAPRVEIDESGGCVVDLGRPAGDDAADALREWLHPSALYASLIHADVRCSVPQVERDAQGRLRVSGSAGAATDGTWRLDVLHQTGYASEALLEFAPGTDQRLRRQVAAAARAQLRPIEDADGLITVEELRPLADAASASWLHLACQSKKRAACQQFVEQTLKLATWRHPRMRLAAGPPAIHAHCSLWPARVPRDAVDVAVETRPAREWQ